MHLAQWSSHCLGWLHQLSGCLVRVPALLWVQLPAETHPGKQQILAQVLEADGPASRLPSFDSYLLLPGPGVGSDSDTHKRDTFPVIYELALH